MNKELFKGCWINFNDRANLYLYGPMVELVETRTVDAWDGQYRLRKYLAGDLEVFTFGFMATDPRKRPGHGGEWSSNSEQINQVFGVNLRECAYNQIACAIKIEDMKDFAPSNVTYEGLNSMGFHEFNMEGDRFARVDLNGNPMSKEDHGEFDHYRFQFFKTEA